uniref:Protoporphyrinogen oxidase n=1 Tax=Labrus bergylta TaxID=56723 RepID=A0A3Q3MQL4_9LABR
PMRTVAVLGGGIGGLAASYYLSKSPQVTKVILLESSGRFGGWLWSTRRSDGAVFEHGPRGIRPAGAVGKNTLNMVNSTCHYSHVLKEQILYVNEQLHRMPSGPSGLLRTAPPFSRPLVLSGMRDILSRRGKQEDETIHSFVSRRLGGELADIAIDSLCRGVFAGDCRKLSVRSCFPVLYNAEQRRGSIILGMLLGSGPGPVVPPGPLAQRSVTESWAQWSLIRGLHGRVQLHSEAAVTKIRPSETGWKIDLEDGVVSADHIISALPAKALSSALPPSCQPIIKQLQDISTVTVAVVNLEYEGLWSPGSFLRGSRSARVVYDSVPFPEHNRPEGHTTRLTVMMGGAWFQEVFGDPESVTEDDLLARATEGVQKHLGVTSAPSWSRVVLQRDCIPQYYLGHFQRVESIRSFIKKNNLPLSLIGSSYDGVSVNDVIFGGRNAAEELLGSVV